MITLDRPRSFKADGRSFLKCSPMSAAFILGNPQNEPEKGLTDMCSNTGIINKSTLEHYYPEIPIRPMINEITGVSKKKTLGWVIVPIWIDCENESKIAYRIQMDVELYVVEEFNVPLQIGMDTFLDYGMDVSLRHMQGDLWVEGEKFTFPLLALPHKKRQEVQVKSAKNVTIFGHECKVIRIKSAMEPGIQYTFHPTTSVPRGLPAFPQLHNRLIDSTTKLMTFVNMSDHPIHLTTGQRLGEASAAPFGSQVITT
ncbi:hypothetical protein Q9L58_010681, partial [Maublancomyces gigas]